MEDCVGSDSEGRNQHDGYPPTGLQLNDLTRGADGERRRGAPLAVIDIVDRGTPRSRRSKGLMSRTLWRGTTRRFAGVIALALVLPILPIGMQAAGARTPGANFGLTFNGSSAVRHRRK